MIMSAAKPETEVLSVNILLHYFGQNRIMESENTYKCCDGSS